VGSLFLYRGIKDELLASDWSWSENRIAKKLMRSKNPETIATVKTVFATFAEISSSAGGWLISA
jgi:hypothetical protein